jgi:hypothetical protein
MIRHLNKSFDFFGLERNSRKDTLSELSVYERSLAGSIDTRNIVHQQFEHFQQYPRSEEFTEYSVDALPARRYSEAVTGNIW